MQYRLRTLLIVLALGPPILAWWGWPIYRDHLERERRAADIMNLPIPAEFHSFANTEEKEAWARQLVREWQRKKQSAKKTSSALSK